MGVERWFSRLAGVVEKAKADKPQAPVETPLDIEETGRWNRDSIEARKQPEGGRGLDNYELCLGFKREDLRGKRVLDLGVGPEGKFAEELGRSGIEARIVGLSPDLSLKRHRDKILEQGTTQSIAALGQELPFKEGSFDVIVSVHVVDHLSGEEDFIIFITEIARVLASGGKAYVGPLFRESHMTFNCYGALHNPELITRLEQAGVEMAIENISEDYGIEKIYDPTTGMGVGHAPYGRLVLHKKEENSTL